MSVPPLYGWTPEQLEQARGCCQYCNTSPKYQGAETKCLCTEACSSRTCPMEMEHFDYTLIPCPRFAEIEKE